MIPNPTREMDGFHLWFQVQPDAQNMFFQHFNIFIMTSDWIFKLFFPRFEFWILRSKS